VQVDPHYLNNLSAYLDQSQATTQQLTSELSSGVRVTSLGQDPVASGENVLMLNQIQQDDSFTNSSNLATGKMQVADSALGSVVTQLTQAITLATSANNGTLNSRPTQAIRASTSSPAERPPPRPSPHPMRPRPRSPRIAGTTISTI
jgi:flagellar hook-associated protein 3 FlgL